MSTKVAWPSGLRRWFKAPVTKVAWVRIPPLPDFFFSLFLFHTIFSTLKFSDILVIIGFYSFEEADNVCVCVFCSKH